jgi:hypothetical protein
MSEAINLNEKLQLSISTGSSRHRYYSGTVTTPGQ